MADPSTTTNHPTTQDTEPIFEFSNLNISSDQGQSSTTVPPVTQTSINNSPASDTEASDDVDRPAEKPKTYDFAILVATKPLRTAIDALSDPTLNTNKEALIYVSRDGFEITVWNVADQNNPVFAGLRLKAKTEGLHDECEDPSYRRLVSLKGLSRLFKDAEKSNRDRGSVVVYSEKDSERLSFKWGDSHLDFAVGFPVSTDLRAADIALNKFPDVTCKFEVSIPSAGLREMISRLQNVSENPFESVELCSRPRSMNLKVNDVILSSSVKEYKVRMNWKYWKSLLIASNLADKCSFHLLQFPPQTVLLRFNLQELGDFVYLSKAVFNSVPDLPFIARFCSLVQAAEEGLY